MFVALISCQKDSIDSSKNINKIIKLSDRNGNIFNFNIVSGLSKDNKQVIYCKKRYDGKDNGQGLYGQTFSLLNMDITSKSEIEVGKLWFVPLSSDLPFRIKLPSKLNSLKPRLSYDLLSWDCYCEQASGQNPQCTLTYANGKPTCNASNCSDCDLEFCYDGIRLPDTRGGGIVIFADTVIFSNNDNVIFGWKTKVNLDHFENDTLFFSREYFSDTTLVFEQCLFNATGEIDIFENIENYSLWFIPFNKNYSAMRVYTPPSCESSTEDACDDDCEQEVVNGCIRCKCCGNGDCDMVPEMKGVLVNTLFVYELQ
jgi:hypothetical protein